MDCPHEKRLELLERKHEDICDTFKKMEDKFDAKLDLILMQINKVAILEEKHTYQSAALSRAFNAIKDAEVSITELTRFKNHTEGMAKMAWLLWGSIGVGTLTLIFKVFFANH